ncbi:KIF-binding protein-like isoform X2 [Odontomachus brunneus]|uniref:KIF-binding protein-like isoform X2 n=1 Tax=Odontomachus brunneus TaxID=486640 RepID=UPI0013F1C7F5|nr:KIF-binding protein-like isoform X2 [Odontomachus brunneus]XP_032662912.1 KIF-binding protein-like isoform X2 [Odontomachus brunneus]
MSTKTTDESKCESALVPRTGMVESSSNFENTIKPSEEFVEFFKLTYTFSKDPSKFSKKQIKTIEIKMDKLFHKVINSQNTKFENIIALAYICQHICFAYIKLGQTEKLSVAKDSILCSLHLIKDKQLDPKIILLTLKANSHLGHVYYKQQKLGKAIEALDKAVDLYFIYMEEHSEYDIPIDYQDIIIKSVQIKNGYSKLKSIYKHILRTLTDVHTQMGSKTNESFILSRHLLLMEELNSLQTFKEHIQWIEKAMTVCNYLIMCNRFGEAESYIDRTFVVQKKIDIKFNDITGKETLLKELRLYEQCFGTYKLITLCHAKLAVALFRYSVERLLRLEKNEDSKANNSTTKYPSKSKEQPSRRLLIFTQNEKAYFDKNTHRNMYPSMYILNHNKVQKYFITILNVIYKSKLFFIPSDINTYIPFTLCISNIYKYIAFYEKDTASRFLLQKRRAEILERAVNILGDKNGCKLLRLLWLQLTIAYSTLIDMKVEEAVPIPYLSERHDTLVDEINVLVENGLIFLRKHMYYK